MRPPLRQLAACGLLLATLPISARAQQGSIQVTAAAHALAGEPRRIGGQPAFEPDVGVSWLRPGTRFGMFQMEIRGTARDGQPHLGRAFASLRDVRHRGVTYTFEAGDSFFAPARGDYQQVRNLYTPAVNFSGISVKASTARTSVGVMAGRATASRNVFGTDTETLDQGLLIGRVSRKLSDRVELLGRASSIRTRDLKEFTFTVADSDQGGGGVRFSLTPSIHLLGDVSAVSFRRRGATDREIDGSALAGLSVLLARGWIQMNASRFSPGELPILAQPHADRQTLYAAGEYDVLRRLRVFGGWESFRTNLDEHALAQGPPSDGGRAFGGVRVPIGARSSAAVRVEDGDRRSRYVGASLTRVSDTGVVSAEMQSAFGRVSAFGRFARRENVESENLAVSYTQHEGSALAFLNLTRQVQLFSSVSALRNITMAGEGHTYWQFGGGTQSQVMQRSLWFRAEGVFSRNVDLLTEREVPQHSFSFGLNGEIAPNTVVAVNVYADRLLSRSIPELDSWMTRSSVRVIRTFATGPHRSTASIAGSMARHGGTGSLVGMVYSDWNANGMQDDGEPPLENIPVRLVNLGNTSTSRAGEFAFVNVPIGLQQIGIDLTSLPVDFDAPDVPQVQVDLKRGDTRRLAFGLVPLGSIGGRVVHDVNANGRADEGEPALEGAVVVLDGGARSEQVRAGRFRFESVRSGTHTIGLLPESLPEGAAIAGEASRSVTIARDALTPDVAFLAAIQTRPEVRRVFPGERALVRRAEAVPAVRDPKPAEPSRPKAAAGPALRAREQFAIQIAALNDPSRAARMVEELRAAGYSAYLVEPPPSDPDAPYRVRVGFYDSRAAAEKVARALEQQRRQKLWVIRER